LTWYAGGDTEYRLPGTDMVFKVSAPTADFLRETRETTGALVFGRRTFDLTHGWGGKHPLDVPVFVVTSSVPQGWVYEGSPFRFVTDGLESALEQAQAVAGNKDVGVGREHRAAVHPGGTPHRADRPGDHEATQGAGVTHLPTAS
jgi:dihydrofolate reductase